tara:strand:+ start:7048 stop:7845 length:798 start_codon:yes stop_codon:yes gene_type:complete
VPEVSPNNKVLLVEDNPINIKLAVSMLERLGLIVTVATNGQEAIDYVQSGEHIDLILMDIQMPVMDGLEATHYLYKNIENCPTIVAMTANVDTQHYNSCIEAGMAGFIEKPIRLAKLKEVLPTHLPTLHIFGDQNIWKDGLQSDGIFLRIDVESINRDNSECWDIFYKFYRDFILYYQNELPKLENAIKANDSALSLKALKEFSDLAIYFHPKYISPIADEIKKNASTNNFGICLKEFRKLRKEAQEVIREVSLLLANQSQKISQ